MASAAAWATAAGRVVEARVGEMAAAGTTEAVGTEGAA